MVQSRERGGGEEKGDPRALRKNWREGGGCWGGGGGGGGWGGGGGGGGGGGCGVFRGEGDSFFFEESHSKSSYKE